MEISPIRLNRAIKSVTDKTAGDIIIDRLTQEAKRLLLFSDLNNKEFAYKLNYEDPSYFARIFRKKNKFLSFRFQSKNEREILPINCKTVKNNLLCDLRDFVLKQKLIYHKD